MRDYLEYYFNRNYKGRTKTRNKKDKKEGSTSNHVWYLQSIKILRTLSPVQLLLQILQLVYALGGSK